MGSDKPKIEGAVEEKIDQKIEAAKIKPSVDSLDTAKNIASKTTVEQDLRTLGQRNLNLLWETTQRNLAYIVIGVSLFANFITVIVGAYALLAGIVPSAIMVAIGTGALMQLNTMAGIVIGFYFGRTNHARMGDEPKRSKGGLDDR